MAVEGNGIMSERDRSSRQSGYSDRSHEETHNLLSEYATATALGQTPWLRYPSTAAHLASCPTCRAELDALLELAVASYTGQVEPLSSYPPFDFSFLQPPASQPAIARPTWFIDYVGRLVVVFSEALLASMRQPSPLRAARGQALYRYTPEPAPPDNLGLSIDVFADDDSADQGNVQVLLDVPGRDPLDQSGIRVTLCVGDLAWEGATGPSGSVTFTAVPLKLLPQLRVEVTLPAKQ
jgi:hypothetical protein